MTDSEDAKGGAMMERIAMTGAEPAFGADGVLGGSASNRGGSTGIRLTRRGRAVLGALATGFVAAIALSISLLGGGTAQASDETGQTEFGYVVIAPGDSLWNVASALDPSADPRDVIAEIMRLNQLQNSEVQVGQTMAVPLRFSDAPGVYTAVEVGEGPEGGR